MASTFLDQLGLSNSLDYAKHLSVVGWLAILSPLFVLALGLVYFLVLVAAPIPRPPRKSEKQYLSVLPNGTTSFYRQLPCWYDDYVARKKLARKDGKSTGAEHTVEDAEVFLTVVVPAYNEEGRLTIMLDDAYQFLRDAYRPAPKKVVSNGSACKESPATTGQIGWEILVVSDGSKDKTVDVALDFARKHKLSDEASEQDLGGTLRVIVLEENRGKGGAVTHGMRHARGRFVVFADADGASRFADVAGLVKGCQKVQDSQGRAVGIGSRAHLVGSEAVVKRSFLRNTLMHSFHLLLRLMTPPATAAIKDTQCGFKLFSRAALPYIIPYMHSEGWIFDVEMLMLAEMANIPMAEVAIGWKEVTGSKLNVIWDSLGMAWGLAVLRAAWITGVYQRDF